MNHPGNEDKNKKRPADRLTRRLIHDIPRLNLIAGSQAVRTARTERSGETRTSHGYSQHSDRGHGDNIPGRRGPCHCWPSSHQRGYTATNPKGETFH